MAHRDPSCEGPEVLRAVLEEAEAQQVLLHRISQGSGIMLMTDAEIREMAQLGREAGIEVSLFVGPRAAWDTGAQVVASAGKNLGARLRGMEQVIFAVEDIRRACALGIRSVLVADEGLLWLVTEMKRAGELPAELVLKVSVQMGAANALSVRWMQQLGAGTYNTPTDLSLPHLAAIRQACELPLDIYVEAPDDFGGFVRHYEIPQMIQVAAPMYVKLGAAQRAQHLSFRLPCPGDRRGPWPRARTSRRHRAGHYPPLLSGRGNFAAGRRRPGHSTLIFGLNRCGAGAGRRCRAASRPAG